MGNDKPVAEQYQALAQVVREKISVHERKTEVMMETLSQLFLLLTTNMSGPGRLSVSALHEEFLSACKPLKMSWQTTFEEVFTGRGPLANYLREKVDFEKIAKLYPEIQSADEAARIILRDIEAFDYKLYEDPHEYKSFLAFLHGLQQSSADMMPFSFAHCQDPRGLEVALSEMNWDTAWNTFPSGFYEDVRRPARADGSIPWILLMKAYVHTPGNDACKVTLLLRQENTVQLFLHHPLEGGWYSWDQKHLMRNLMRSLVQEYALHSMTLMRPRAVKWDFQSEVDDLVAKNRKYLWQHQCLPPQTLFAREGDPAPGVFADFMWVEGSARLTVIGVEVCMVFYCTQHKGEWKQEVRFIRPQHPKSLITIPVDASSLTEEQQRTLIQRAHYAIELKNRVIFDTQQKEKETA